MTDAFLFLSFTVLTGMGISVGFHRLFTHRAFQCRKWVAFLLGVFGSMAGQGRLSWWVKTHAQHHRHADRPLDPHSPVQRGFWHAHFLWLVRRKIDLDPRYKMGSVAGVIDRTYWLWFALGLMIPFAIGGWSGLVWGGLVRLVWVWNATWAINSICHLADRRSSYTGDYSRNIKWLAPLTFGEALHHSHHAHAMSALFSDSWYLDPGGAVIRILQKLGLAWGVRTV